MMKFRERFMMGEVPFDDIFSLTDKWNFSDEACTLREYLGLTAKEEDVWISDSDDALEELMEKKKIPRQFSWIWTERSLPTKRLFLPATVRRSKRLLQPDTIS